MESTMTARNAQTAPLDARRRPMKTLKLALLAAALAAPAAAPAADDAAPLPLRYKVRADWVYAYYGKDVYDCWNNGLAATCGRTRSQLEGETEARVMHERELSDVLELRLQLGAEAYHRNGWTERSARATGETAGRPRWVAHVFDTWIGLNHIDHGTVRIGSGLNPFQQASGQIDGNTDLGGREYLERMVAYDSPLLWGDKATGASLNLAVYDGARYRKARHELAGEDRTRAARAKGVSVLLDGRYDANLSAKLAVYAERYGARKYYNGGPLDGLYTLLPGASATSPDFNEDNPAITRYDGGGASARSRGIALDVSQQADSHRIGGELLLNRRLPTRDLVTATFAQNGYGTGYKSTGAALYFSTWQGPWSLWSKVSVIDFRLTEPEGLNASSDWLFPNSTYRTVKAGGEVAYALNEQARAIVGAEWMRRNFKESPLAQGVCATGQVRACYDPKGYKLFAGVRSNF